jgi:choline monooxygenase
MSDGLSHLLAAFDAGLPLERARTIPASWYTDAAMARAEQEHVFGRSWCVVGRSEQTAVSGSFVTAEVAGWPILVVRDDEGVLRAFLNVCRHRAAPLLTEPCGSATRLRCRYHGWTYDLAGRLRGVPEFDGVADFRREDNGLHEIAVATWGPLLAVRVGGGNESFSDQLGPLPQKVGAGLAGLEFACSKEYTVDCNWKVYVDNFLDGGYHVNTVHPGLAGMIDYSRYRTETHDWTSVQTSPLTTAAGSVRAGEAQYWFMFPNFMLNLYDGVMDTNRVLPLGPDRCRVMFDFWFASSGAAADGAFREQSIATAEQVQAEDMGICAEVQRGLASGAFQTGRFSVKRETAGYHFHRLLARRLGAAIE